MTETVLQEADRIVAADRRDDYGHPFDDFSRTAKMWSGIFGVDVTPEQVAMAMVCIKISRELNKPKRDNRVDMAGYTKCLDMVVERRESNEPQPAERTGGLRVSWLTLAPHEPGEHDGWPVGTRFEPDSAGWLPSIRQSDGWYYRSENWHLYSYPAHFNLQERINVVGDGLVFLP